MNLSITKDLKYNFRYSSYHEFPMKIFKSFDLLWSIYQAFRCFTKNNSMKKNSPCCFNKQKQLQKYIFLTPTSDHLQQIWQWFIYGRPFPDLSPIRYLPPPVT